MCVYVIETKIVNESVRKISSFSAQISADVLACNSVHSVSARHEEKGSEGGGGRVRDC